MTLKGIPDHFGDTISYIPNSIFLTDYEYRAKYETCENVVYQDDKLKLGKYTYTLNLGGIYNHSSPLMIMPSHINYIECNGYKCRQTLEKSVKHWCRSCHGEYEESCDESDVELLVHKDVKIDDVMKYIIERSFQVLSLHGDDIIPVLRRMGGKNPYPKQTKKFIHLYRKDQIKKSIPSSIFTKTPYGTIEVPLTEEQKRKLYKEKKLSIRSSRLYEFYMVTSKGKYSLTMNGNVYHTAQIAPIDLTDIGGSIITLKPFKIEKISLVKTIYGVFLKVFHKEYSEEKEFLLTRVK